MSTRRLARCEADRRTATCIAAAVNTSAVVCVCVKAVFRRELALKRISARISEKETAARGDEQAPTEGGPDKRPQCAARAVGCFCFCFSRIRQCVASACNVRLNIILLPRLLFSHIAEAGDG